MEATLLRGLKKEQADLIKALEELVGFYKQGALGGSRAVSGSNRGAAGGRERTRLLLAMGDEAEGRVDWEGAARHYVRALAEKPTDPDLA